MGIFSINQTGPEELRPCLINKVKEYFEGFVTDNILHRNGIMLPDSRNICLIRMYF
ncbi:hypothetical protein SAMN04488128_103472 [Chitinophaga eiseniae]|uniref:Uncharacterized protein n=1 Tax=Chitinophaga eiseniae TaxID=634771 RepID=A0A1T4SU37_9BACT|nr:hypothetical protein SAMN04488128_103472 [Chitinophaga eiseniae]